MGLRFASFFPALRRLWLGASTRRRRLIHRVSFRPAGFGGLLVEGGPERPRIYFSSPLFFTMATFHGSVPCCSSQITRTSTWRRQMAPKAPIKWITFFAISFVRPTQNSSPQLYMIQVHLPLRPTASDRVCPTRRRCLSGGLLTTGGCWCCLISLTAHTQTPRCRPAHALGTVALNGQRASRSTHQ